MINVYRVEYTLGESSWIACIAAYKGEEAIECLRSRLAAPVIVSIAKDTRIDGFSAQVRDVLIEESGYDTPTQARVEENVPESGLDTLAPPAKNTPAPENIFKRIVKMRKKKTP